MLKCENMSQNASWKHNTKSTGQVTNIITRYEYTHDIAMLWYYLVYLYNILLTWRRAYLVCMFINTCSNFRDAWEKGYKQHWSNNFKTTHILEFFSERLNRFYKPQHSRKQNVRNSGAKQCQITGNNNYPMTDLYSFHLWNIRQTLSIQFT